MKGKLNFGYATSSIEGESIRIEIIDALSRVHFLEVTMSPEDFARAAFGHRGEIDCDFELRRPDLLGKKHEHKMVAIPWTKGVNRETIGKLRDAAPKSLEAAVLRNFLSKYEVEGWIAYQPDLFNHHRYIDGGVSVAFHRHVDIPLPPPPVCGYEDKL